MSGQPTHIAVPFLKKDISIFILICYTTTMLLLLCYTIWFIKQIIVKSAYRIEAVYMFFNETSIWGGETPKVYMYAIIDGFLSNVISWIQRAIPMRDSYTIENDAVLCYV